MGTIERNKLDLLLRHLASLYPESEGDVTAAVPEMDEASSTAHVRYLYDHGLVDTKWYKTGEGLLYSDVALTAKGYDRVLDDGGLTAEMGVVKVKLHEDTLKALLAEAVKASAEPDSVKARLLDQIKSLPAEATKQAVLEAAKAGLQNAPSIAVMLGKWLLPGQ